jgi:hypothetical protein
MKNFFQIYREAEGASAAVPATPPVAPEAPPVAQPDPAPVDPPVPSGPAEGTGALPSSVLRRITDLNSQLQQTKAELEAYKAGQVQQPIPSSAPVPSPLPRPRDPAPDFNIAVQEEARRIADQQAFTNKANEVWNKGVSSFPDFAQSVTQMATLLGDIPRDMTEAAILLGEPEKIIYELSKKPDEAARIALMPPTLRGAALAQFAAQSKAQAPRVVSDAPAPIPPVVGSPSGSGGATIDDPNLPIDEWMKRRNAQVGRR